MVCGPLRFGFDERRARALLTEAAGTLLPDQRVPVYGLPFTLTDDDLWSDRAALADLAEDGFRTVLRLPFRAGVDAVAVAAQVRATIAPELLLFLDATSELQVVGTSADFRAEVVREQADDHEEVLLEVTGSRDLHHLVYRAQVPVADRSLVAELGKAWQEVEHVRVAVAVPIDDDGLPCSGAPQPLHVYFPTEEASGLPLLLHADFALDLDRKRVAATPQALAYNAWLSSCLVRFIAETVVPSLARLATSDASGAVVRAVAPSGVPTGFGVQLHASLLEALRDAAFLPCADGTTRPPTAARLLPASVPDPFRVQALAPTAAGPCVVPGLEATPATRRFLAVDLAVPQLDLREVLAGLEPDRAIDDEHLYDLLLDWADRAGGRAFAPLLRDVACVRVVDGGWRRPPEVFFERQRGSIDFPETLHVPLARLPEGAALRALLEQAGVRPFEWRHLVSRLLVPLLSDPSETEERRRAGFEALASYVRTERSGDAQLEKALAGVLVRARNATGSREELRAVSGVYFSSEWLGHDRLERLFGMFDECEFLAEPTPAGEGVHDRAFWERIGVSPCVRVAVEVDERRRYALGWNGTRYVLPAHHPHAKQAPRAWRAWAADAQVQAAAACPRGHTASQVLSRSVVLDGVEQLIDAGDWGRLSVLLTEMSQNWASTCAAAMTSDFTCLHGEHPGSSRTAPSLLAHVLAHEAWVPAVRDGTPVVVPGRRAWRLGYDTPRAVRRSVACVPTTLDHGLEGFAAAAGFVDAARPTALQLVWLLQQLDDETQDEPAPDKGTQDAARWAMRTLNDVLDDAGASALQRVRVPLLARLGDGVQFTARPYVASDRQLADTWQSTHPILDGDRDLGRLQRALGLPDLDRDVTVVPRPEGRDGEALARVEASLRAALPHLHAVAVDHAPALATQVARRLLRLDVVVCRTLSVVYKLGDDERERAAETCHIATRVETDGRRRQYGTAHLELDAETQEPDWYRLGSLLAEYVGSPPVGHAFSLLLASMPSGRQLFLRSLGIGPERLLAAREQLGQDVEDDDVEQELAQLVQHLETSLAQVGVPTAPPDAPEPAPAAVLGAPGPSPEPHTEEPELPPVDPAKVQVRHVTTRPGPAPVERAGHRGGGLGPQGAHDHDAQHRRNRTIGHRGEQAVVDHERARLRRRGLDPALVRWVSREHPFAPYDVTTVDEDGLTSYIEVKSTSGADPSAPFPISEAELLEAVRRGGRYQVYRVLRADTDAPQIVPFADPVTLLREGHAALTLHGARMCFFVDETEAEDGDGDGDGEA